jgi:hypothetical protein
MKNKNFEKMSEIEKKIENTCKKYNLPIFPNIRDNLMDIIESAEPSSEEKLITFELYEEWLYMAFENDEE